MVGLGDWAGKVSKGDSGTIGTPDPKTMTC